MLFNSNVRLTRSVARSLAKGVHNGCLQPKAIAALTSLSKLSSLSSASRSKITTSSSQTTHKSLSRAVSKPTASGKHHYSTKSSNSSFLTTTTTYYNNKNTLSVNNSSSMTEMINRFVGDLQSFDPNRPITRAYAAKLKHYKSLHCPLGQGALVKPVPNVIEKNNAKKQLVDARRTLFLSREFRNKQKKFYANPQSDPIQRCPLERELVIQNPQFRIQQIGNYWRHCYNLHHLISTETVKAKAKKLMIHEKQQEFMYFKLRYRSNRKSSKLRNEIKF